MPTKRSPRRGTMQFWPRKRAKKPIARVRQWTNSNEAKPLGFPGYKVGMTQVFLTDNRPTSLTKGDDICWPVTIIECPPIKVASLVFYKKNVYGLHAVSQVFAEKLDKDFARKMIIHKNAKKHIADIKLEDFDDIRLLIYTQPRLVGIGKKKPEAFEIGLGGSKEDKFKVAQEKLGKEIYLKDVLKEGMVIDLHGITEGKGFQGPVKRFGVAIGSHKAQKTRRGPASLGAWHGNRSWTVAHAGQMGFHQRTEYNKWILMIGDDASKINTPSGYRAYGVVKNNFILLKGSVMGPPKRLITMTAASRKYGKVAKEAPTITYIKV